MAKTKTDVPQTIAGCRTLAEELVGTAMQTAGKNLSAADAAAVVNTYHKALNDATPAGKNFATFRMLYTKLEDQLDIAKKAGSTKDQDIIKYAMATAYLEQQLLDKMKAGQKTYEVPELSDLRDDGIDRAKTNAFIQRTAELKETELKNEQQKKANELRDQEQRKTEEQQKKQQEATKKSKWEETHTPMEVATRRTVGDKHLGDVERISIQVQEYVDNNLAGKSLTAKRYVIDNMSNTDLIKNFSGVGDITYNDTGKIRTILKDIITAEEAIAKGRGAQPAPAPVHQQPTQPAKPETINISGVTAVGAARDELFEKKNPHVPKDLGRVDQDALNLYVAAASGGKTYTQIMAGLHKELVKAKNDPAQAHKVETAIVLANRIDDIHTAQHKTPPLTEIPAIADYAAYTKQALATAEKADHGKASKKHAEKQTPEHKPDNQPEPKPSKPVADAHRERDGHREFKDGVYAIQAGDTLYRIMRDNKELVKAAREAFGDKVSERDAILGLAIITAKKNGMPDVDQLACCNGQLIMPTKDDICNAAVYMKAAGHVLEDNKLQYKKEVKGACVDELVGQSVQNAHVQSGKPVATR